MRYLVTGGLGLIGSHLVENLIDSGNQVFVLDDASTGRTSNLRNVVANSRLEIVSSSILNKDSVNLLMKKVDACFHLAASLGVMRILEKPLVSLEVNLSGTENVLKSAGFHKVPVFVASTSEIYGRNPEQPLREDSDRVLGSPLKTRWAYSEAKALDETLAMILNLESGLDFVVGRYFNVVGPRQVGTYGMVLPRFVQSALRNEDLKVYGSGHQTRVFCHVSDAVDATLRLMQSKTNYSNAFNIGGSEEISIRDLAARVIQVTKSESSVTFVDYDDVYPTGFEETNRRVPDTTKLQSAVGWKAKRNLDEIILDVAAWFQSET